MNKTLLLLVLAGCVDTRDPITGTQSLRIELVSPASPGSLTQRLDDAARTIIVNVTAIDAEGELDASFNNPVRVYVNFLGTLTPYLDQAPLTTIAMNAGVATNQTVMLPPVFGASTLWFDDGGATAPTFA